MLVVRDGRTEWVLNPSTGTEIPYRQPDQNIVPMGTTVWVLGEIPPRDDV